MFKVVYSEWLDKQIKKLTRLEQQRIKRFERQIKTQPFSGRPLGYNFIREKKFNGKRLLFLVYAQYSAVLFAYITDKKFQQDMIDELKDNLYVYEQKLKELLGTN